jgi:hypothetical protein
VRLILEHVLENSLICFGFIDRGILDFYALLLSSRLSLILPRLCVIILVRSSFVVDLQEVKLFELKVNKYS